VDLKDIRQIVKLMDEHGLSLFQLEQEGFALKLKKGIDSSDLTQALGCLPAAQQVAPQAFINAQAQPAAAPTSAPAAPAVEGQEITSPMVGTFYRRPSPDATNFVSVGDQVEVGQVICIIEAMKVLNEIKADKAGTITAVLVEDATPVQYGDALFRIK